MVVKVIEKFENTKHVKNNDKSKKYILCGERNVRYHDRILSNEQKSFIYIFVNSTCLRYIDTYCFCQICRR